MDKMMKGIKTIVEAELNDSETSVLPEIRFTVERLKVQIQQELKCSHTDKESICQLSKTIEESNTELNWPQIFGKWRLGVKKQLQRFEQKTSPSSDPFPSSSTCPVDMFSQLVLKISWHNWHRSLFPVCESTFKHPQTVMGRLHTANLTSVSQILPARNQISPVKDSWLREQWKSRGNLVLVRKHLKQVYRFSGLCWMAFLQPESR